MRCCLCDFAGKIRTGLQRVRIYLSEFQGVIGLTGPSDVSGGTAYAAQARMQSGDYNDKKTGTESGCFLTVSLASGDGDLYHPDKRGCKGPVYRIYAEKENTIDAILVGSSPVYPYYSAPALYGKSGIAAYPLSTNNQRPKAIKYLLKEAQKTQDPSLFIIEMRMFSMPDEEWEDTMIFTRGVTDNLKYSKTVWMPSMRSSATGGNATPTILIFSNIIPTGKRFFCRISWRAGAMKRKIC